MIEEYSAQIIIETQKRNSGRACIRQYRENPRSVAQDMHSFSRLIATTQFYIPLYSMQLPHVVVLVIPYPKLPRKYLERI